MQEQAYLIGGPLDGQEVKLEGKHIDFYDMATRSFTGSYQWIISEGGGITGHWVPND